MNITPVHNSIRVSRNSLKRKGYGFSLVELLAAIAIIAILAGILISVISSIRQRGSSATSASNLRATYVALQLYIQEHDGYFPGPIQNGQLPIYGAAWMNRYLPNYLHPYMDVPPATDKIQVLDCFTFPAYLDHDPDMDGPAYFAVSSLVINKVNCNLWGYYASKPANRGTPMKQSYVMDNLNASSTMLLTEIDQQYISGVGWASLLPETPYHGDIRNQLFLDGSVRATPVE